MLDDLKKDATQRMAKCVQTLRDQLKNCLLYTSSVGVA